MSEDRATQATPDIETLRDALRAVIDPEAGMNIVDLGLIYRIEVVDDALQVDMTMTSPACPMGYMIAEEAASVLRAQLSANLRPDVRVVWSPPWEPAMMSEEARRHFGW